MKKTVIALLIGLVAVVGLVACTGDPLQTWADAEVSSTNEEPAIVGTMPDGFSNFAAKCDGSNMVYVIYHSTSAYGGIDVVPNDPRCAS